LRPIRAPPESIRSAPHSHLLPDTQRWLLYYPHEHTTRSVSTPANSPTSPCAGSMS
jgi:hypothetical protein